MVYIAFEQHVSSNLTEVIQNEVGAESIELHNLSVLTPEDEDNDETYFTLMEKNLDTLEMMLK
ncbi:zinc ABC transporter substrate-binding protein [Planococcus sp. ISL-109]|nr:zinc ABC transporter substrate-binding protein [Planococcus sp. ISL-109]